MSVKDSITTQTCELSQEEFNDFLALYPVPSEYHVILPKSNQTIFDALPGYVGLYTHSFSLANLRLPLTEFFCEVLEYFQKLRVDRALPSRGFSSICVELRNKLDLKSFKDKLPLNFEENPLFQRLSRYTTSVRVFPDPILILAGLKPSWECGQQRPAIMAGEKNGFCRDTLLVIKRRSDEESYRLGDDTKASPVLRGYLLLGSSTSRATVQNFFSTVVCSFLTVADDDERLPDCLELRDASQMYVERAQKIIAELSYQMPIDIFGAQLNRLLLLMVKKARLQKAVEYQCYGRRKGLKKISEAACCRYFGRRRAFEQVADMKEPFYLSKVKGYRPSYKKDHTQASNDLATATFPWLNEFVSDSSAPIEALLSKKPLTLRRHAPSKTQVPVPSSQRATPSSALVSNLMSPLIDASIMKPQSS
ncbi:hypothetical protein Tco_0418902 [Tanacetum coccineum]